IAGVNVIAADTSAEAQEQFESMKRQRVRQMLGRGQKLSDEDVESILASPAGAQVLEMVRCSAVGTGPEVAAELGRFAEQARADELIVSLASPGRENRLRSLELLAEAHGLAPAA